MLKLLKSNTLSWLVLLKKIFFIQSQFIRFSNILCHSNNWTANKTTWLSAIWSSNFISNTIYVNKVQCQVVLSASLRFYQEKKDKNYVSFNTKDYDERSAGSKIEDLFNIHTAWSNQTESFISICYSLLSKQSGNRYCWVVGAITTWYFVRKNPKWRVSREIT